MQLQYDACVEPVETPASVVVPDGGYMRDADHVLASLAGRLRHTAVALAVCCVLPAYTPEPPPATEPPPVARPSATVPADCTEPLEPSLRQTPVTDWIPGIEQPTRRKSPASEGLCVFTVDPSAFLSQELGWIPGTEQPVNPRRPAPHAWIAIPLEPSLVIPWAVDWFVDPRVPAETPARQLVREGTFSEPLEPSLRLTPDLSFLPPADVRPRRKLGPEPYTTSPIVEPQSLDWWTPPALVVSPDIRQVAVGDCTSVDVTSGIDPSSMMPLAERPRTMRLVIESPQVAGWPDVSSGWSLVSEQTQSRVRCTPTPTPTLTLPPGPVDHLVWGWQAMEVSPVNRQRLSPVESAVAGLAPELSLHDFWRQPVGLVARHRSSAFSDSTQLIVVTVSPVIDVGQAGIVIYCMADPSGAVACQIDLSGAEACMVDPSGPAAVQIL